MAKSFFDYYKVFLTRGRFYIVGVWFIVLVLGVLTGPKLFSATDTSFDPPSGTLGATANHLMTASFPEKDNLASYIMLITRTSENPSPCVESDGIYLRALTVSLLTRLPVEQKEWYVGMEGYYVFKNSTLDVLANSFITPDCQTAMITIDWYDTPTSESQFLDWMQSLVDGHKAKYSSLTPGYTIGLTGQTLLFTDVQSGTVSDAARTDSIVLPISLFILSLYIKSFRLLLLPFICVLCTILTSFSILYAFAHYHVLKVASFCPSIMLSLSIAVSIDSTLFLFTRYREELVDRKRTNETAVLHMIFHAGHVVCVSGTTLALTFLGLVLFPMDFLRSLGLGAFFALICAVCVNMTLNPAILLIFGGFFSNFNPLPCTGPFNRFVATYCCKCCSTREERALVGRTDPDDANEPLNEPEAPQSPRHKLLAESQASFWYRSAKFSTTKAASACLIISVFGLAIPLLLEVISMTTTIDGTQLFPRDSPSLQVYVQMQDAFGVSVASPFLILATSTAAAQAEGISDLGSSAHLPVPASNIDATAIPSVLSPSYFDTSYALIGQLINSTYTANGETHPLIAANKIDAISWGVGEPLSLPFVTGYLLNPEVNTTAAELFRFAYKSSTNRVNTTTIISLTCSFDPLGEDSRPWVDAVRAILGQYNDAALTRAANGGPPGWIFYVTDNGGTVDALDAVKQIYGDFPMMIAVTLTVVFVMAGVIFRSALLPVRLLLSISVPIITVYGLGVLVFQKGALDNTNLFGAGVLKKTHALYWLAPIMSFSILVGLGLDYDIFLYSRIMEFRVAGYDERVSIMKGVQKTGGIITGAGCIMAVAFGGMMFSQELVLNEFGFFLCFTVLIDTFIVRTMVVPALINLIGTWNWWPTKMKPVTRDENYLENPEDDDPMLVGESEHNGSGGAPKSNGDGSVNAHLSPMHDHARAVDAEHDRIAGDDPFANGRRPVETAASPAHPISRMTVDDD